MRAQPSEDGATLAMKMQGDFLTAHGDSPFAPSVRMRLGDFQTAMGSHRPAAGAYRDVLEGAHSTDTQRQEAIWKLFQAYRMLSEYDEALRLVVGVLGRNRVERALANGGIGSLLRDGRTAYRPTGSMGPPSDAGRRSRSDEMYHVTSW